MEELPGAVAAGDAQAAAALLEAHPAQADLGPVLKQLHAAVASLLAADAARGLAFVLGLAQRLCAAPRGAPLSNAALKAAEKRPMAGSTPPEAIEAARAAVPLVHPQSMRNVVKAFRIRGPPLAAAEVRDLLARRAWGPIDTAYALAALDPDRELRDEAMAVLPALLERQEILVALVTPVPELKRAAVWLVDKERGYKSALKLMERLGIPATEPEFRSIRIASLRGSLSYAALKGLTDSVIDLAHQEDDPEVSAMCLAALLKHGHVEAARSLPHVDPADIVPVARDGPKEAAASEQPVVETLALEPGVSITFADSESGIADAMRAVAAHGICGIDAEWRPSVGSGGGQTAAAIVQIATATQVFVLDLWAVASGRLPPAVLAPLHGVLGDVEITKVGFGFKQDQQRLQAVTPSMALQVRNLIDLQNIVPSAWRKASLSKLTEAVLGKPLSKREQVSDWQRRPLSAGQLAYAAMDAHVLLRLLPLVQEDTGTLAAPPPTAGGRRKARGPARRQPNAGRAEARDCEVRRENAATAAAIAAMPQRDVKLLCDETLLKLGRRLRVIGIDTVFLVGERLDDYGPILGQARLDRRVLVTLSRRTAEKAQRFGMRALVVLERHPDEQLRSMIDQCGFQVGRATLMTRCCACNESQFVRRTADQIRAGEHGTHRPKDSVLAAVDEFWMCQACGKMFWEGRMFESTHAFYAEFCNS